MELNLNEQQINTLRYFLEINLTENVSATHQAIIRQILNKLEENYEKHTDELGSEDTQSVW